MRPPLFTTRCRYACKGRLRCGGSCRLACARPGWFPGDAHRSDPASPTPGGGRIPHRYAQPRPALGACRGPVLAADPSLVSQLVDEREQPRVVELPGIGLDTIRRTRDLEVPDVAFRAAQPVPELRRHVALDDLAVVEVELDLDVRGADLGHQRMRVGLAVERIAGVVSGIEWFHEQGDAGLGRARGRLAQVGDEGGAALLRARVRVRHPPHRMQPWATGRPAVAEREIQPLPELRLAPRQSSESTLPFFPRRQIEQDRAQIVLPQPLPNGGFRRLPIRELVLDGPEAAAGRGLEAIQERALGEEIAQVGGEAGHGGVMIAKWTAALIRQRPSWRTRGRVAGAMRSTARTSGRIQRLDPLCVRIGCVAGRAERLHRRHHDRAQRPPEAAVRPRRRPALPRVRTHSMPTMVPEPADSASRPATPGSRSTAPSSTSAGLERIEIRREFVDLRDERTHTPGTTNAGGVRDDAAYITADRRKIRDQRKHLVVAAIAQHEQRVCKRAHLKLTADGDRPSGIRAGLSVMRSDLDLRVTSLSR